MYLLTFVYVRSLHLCSLSFLTLMHVNDVVHFGIVYMV